MSLEQELVKQINSLQKQIDTLVKPEVGRWQSWIPTVTQGVAVTCNIIFARYKTKDNEVVLEVDLTITSAGTAGQPIVISGLPTAIQPVNAASNTHVIGSALVLGTVYYQGSIIVFGANALRFVAHGTVAQIGQDPPFGLGNGDTIGFQATYERA